MTGMDSRHADYVELMLNAATQARSYVDGISKDDFLADAKTQDAVMMKLLVIGELAVQLLDEHAVFVGNHPEIPWHQMKGMRNRMAHGYFELDLDVVWETIQVAIPDLETKLHSII
ncbi:MAG TPA: DUF86 domain-containing protein [Rhodocyclaceae bacterium]|nr:DUF86 domain-containing protein [Rhodocyclaceae bacterium]